MPRAFRQRSSSHGPRLLVLGAGRAQFAFLAAAARRGVWTAVVDRDPGAPGFQFADRRCIVSIDDELAIERLASALELDGVVAPSSDWPVAVAARVADKLGIAHPLTPAAAVLATNKVRQRERLKNAGIPVPHWEVARDDGLSSCSLPVLVRPADRHGELGCSVVDDWAGLPAAVTAARAESRTGVALVEELNAGPELTVIGLVTARLQIELGVLGRLGTPATDADRGPAATMACRAVAALGVERGLTFTHVRLGGSDPEILEVAAGAGGDDVDLMAGATGVDLSALALGAALGWPRERSETFRRLRAA